MAPSTNFRGVFPILATPFHEDESVDLDSMRRLVSFMARIGVDGVTVLGGDFLRHRRAAKGHPRRHALGGSGAGARADDMGRVNEP